MKHYNLIIILLFIFCVRVSAQNQKTDTIKIVQNYLGLNEKNMNLLVSNDSIINELYKAVKDSVRVKKINKRLELFFNRTYNVKKLVIALELERALKDSNSSSFEFDDSLDPNKALHFDSIEEFLAFKKKLDSGAFGKLKLKDSIIKKKNRK